VRISVVENGIAGLCYLFTEAAKVNLSELDFVDSLMVLGLSSDTNAIIKQVREFDCAEIPMKFSLNPL
jgi:hypothetical protein